MGTVRYFVTCNGPPLPKFNSLFVFTARGECFYKYLLRRSHLRSSFSRLPITWEHLTIIQTQLKTENWIVSSSIAKKRKRRWNIPEGWIEKETCALSEFLNCERYEFFKNCARCDFLMSISRLLGLQVHGNYLFRNNNAKHWYINNLTGEKYFLCFWYTCIYARSIFSRWT